MAISLADFEYVWPREPLVAELSKLLTASDIEKRAEQLLTDALGPRALRALAAMRSSDKVRAVVGEVLYAFHALPTASDRTPYCARREGELLDPPV